jgi:hypothetical protein
LPGGGCRRAGAGGVSFEASSQLAPAPRPVLPAPAPSPSSFPSRIMVSLWLRPMLRLISKLTSFARGPAPLLVRPAAGRLEATSSASSLRAQPADALHPSCRSPCHRSVFKTLTDQGASRSQPTVDPRADNIPSFCPSQRLRSSSRTTSASRARSSRSTSSSTSGSTRSACSTLSGTRTWSVPSLSALSPVGGHGRRSAL